MSRRRMRGRGRDFLELLACRTSDVWAGLPHPDGCYGSVIRRSERLAHYREVLGEIGADEHGFATFEDADSPDRKVQVAMGSSDENLVEATNQYNDDPPPESPEVLERLTRLGFAVTDDELYPWRPIDVNRLEPAAELIDDAFQALGAQPDFNPRLYAKSNVGPSGSPYRDDSGPPDMSWVSGLG